MKIKCYQIEKLVSADIDGMLGASEQEILNEHVRNCPACQKLYNDFKILHKQARVYAEPAKTPILSENFDERFFARLQQEKSRRSPFLVFPRLRLAPVFALLLLAIGMFSLNTRYKGKTESGLSVNTPVTAALNTLENEEIVRQVDMQAKEILRNFL